MKGQALLEKRVQNLFDRFPRKSLQRRDIAEMLNLHGGERKQLTGILRKLVADGAVDLKKGMYRLRQGRKLIRGVFSKTDKGYGFVRCDESEQADLFIAARDVASAMSIRRRQTSTC